MTSSIRELLWLLPSALTSQPDLWLSWDAANKKPGLDERWQHCCHQKGRCRALLHPMLFQLRKTG